MSTVPDPFGRSSLRGARPRRYFSARTGRRPNSAMVDLALLRRVLGSVFSELQAEGYFQEAFGYDCVDDPQFGLYGRDVDAFFLRRLRKPDLWPIIDQLDHYSEDDVFDVIELLFDIVSKPVDGLYHSYANCGWHYTTFNRTAGQDRFREDINEILAEYGDGWELSAEGEVLALGDGGLRDLLKSPLPQSADRTNVRERVERATLQFRRRGSSIDDRRQAVRELVDVLEFLRPQLKTVITSKDEGDLFNIANNFGIRHHNDRQKTDYEQEIWLSWMFYYYLATIHMAVRRLGH